MLIQNGAICILFKPSGGASPHALKGRCHIGHSTFIPATSKQLWKLNDLTTQVRDRRAKAAINIQLNTGKEPDVKTITTVIEIPFPLSKAGASMLIKELIGCLD